MNFFRKEPTVKEQQRENDRELRKAGRDLERDKIALEREEKKLEMEIKKMAKEGNNEGCKMLAKQLVQMRKQKTRLYTANSKSSDGTTDCIPPDDILDRVAKLLSSTICDGTIPYGGDIELDEPASGSEGGLHASSCDGSGDEFVLGDIRVQNGVKLQGLQDETQQNGEIIHVWGKQNQSNSIQDNWQTAKHRAQAEYYKKKKEYLDAKMEQILLENIKLKLEIEKLRISSVQIQNKAMGANIAIAGAMGATAKTMGSMNKIMNPQQIAKDMEAFKQANLKMDMTDDMISDTLDDIMTESGDEEESEGIVNQVLDEIGIEVSGKMANAPSVARNKVGESTSDIDKELMAQLTKLKS
ncbi:jg15065 [Pararge aegeria aegeria]|uniref:Jg15065 protein n=1 Tax=Pararge aegeria aegeria TaxID=348720 RepID=A0A8S4SI74_9NEOP|nr:jg15065 [Pararge aegeria aegeria]